MKSASLLSNFLAAPLLLIATRSLHSFVSYSMSLRYRTPSTIKFDAASATTPRAGLKHVVSSSVLRNRSPAEDDTQKASVGPSDLTGS